MKEKQISRKKVWIIGGIAAVVVLAAVLAIVIWCMQIRLTQPVNVTAGEAGMHSVMISWDEVEHATSYEVSVYQPEETVPLLTEETDTAMIELEGLAADQSYEVTVIAVYEKGDKHVQSEPSQRVSVLTAAPEPGNVNGLIAETDTAGSIAIRWEPYETDDVQADGTAVEISYTVFVSETKDGTYEILAENLAEAEYLHEGLEELDTYYYEVSVQEQMDGNSYSGPAGDAPVSATTGIGVVEQLAAEGISDSQIQISWDAYPLEKENSDGTPVTFRYTLYAAESETADYEVLADELTDTSYVEENLEPETTRYYKVSVTAQKDGEDISGEQTEAVHTATKERPAASTGGSGGSSAGRGGNAGGGTSGGGSSESAQKDAQARAVAQQIAAGITGSSDLEKIRQAAQIVAAYCYNATYTSDDPDYKTAYGVFCKGVYTCAGATRALGMVLECMGYSWEHVNEHQWTHQWCRVTMDGQVGWADGMGGIADYGESPFASGGTYTDSDGVIYFVP